MAAENSRLATGCHPEIVINVDTWYFYFVFTSSYAMLHFMFSCQWGKNITFTIIIIIIVIVIIIIIVIIIVIIITIITILIYYYYYYYYHDYLIYVFFIIIIIIIIIIILLLLLLLLLLSIVATIIVIVINVYFPPTANYRLNYRLFLGLFPSTTAQAAPSSHAPRPFGRGWGVSGTHWPKIALLGARWPWKATTETTRTTAGYML